MYIADLHIHSKYSRATSKDCLPEYLELWARRKGIGLLGTGDFTHPAWRAELFEKLVPAEEGLYTLKPEFQIQEDGAISGQTPRFVVTGEISSIYKQDGRVRKVHNLILLPSLAAAELLARRLEAIGNVHSDGRPILGLSSRDLLEITLETCADAVFIPAHIWTPHFSMFGAFSGFDTIKDCFLDLTPHIHALETGLSSDPAMNWQLSALDGYTLVSNSDAHSPSKLGREANLIDAELSYPALARALCEGTSAGFGGTIEFFPEEGKYHLDGHRNCGVCFTPSETAAHGGRCPVCGGKITIGVQHRLEQLADRKLGFVPENACAFSSLVPLPEVIAGSTGLSAASVKVSRQYEKMLHALGPEFYILREAPISDIARISGPYVAEGIRRLRAGDVMRKPGFDGQYGVITLLDQADMDALGGQASLFSSVEFADMLVPKTTSNPKAPQKNSDGGGLETPKHTEALNEAQSAAVLAKERAVAVIAGPGTGKTKTLVAKIAHLVEEAGVKPSEITAVTFTNKAAAEMRQRLEKRLGGKRAVRAMTIGTFHAICLEQLKQAGENPVLVSAQQAQAFAELVLKSLGLKTAPKAFLEAVSRKKCGMQGDAAQVPVRAFEQYEAALGQAGVLDFDDLLLRALSLPAAKKSGSYLLVDEFQDINETQYQLVCAWSRAGKGLFVIGDPDQSIYGFRGSNAHCFDRLSADFKNLRTIYLENNYRSTPQVLSCALPVIEKNGRHKRVLCAQRTPGAAVRYAPAPTEFSEAVFVAKEINRLVGGVDMLDAQAMSRRRKHETVCSFSDIAVLYRTHRQAKLLEKCLAIEGIPYVVTGRDDTLDHPKVQGLIGFFKFLQNRADIFSLCAFLNTFWDLPKGMGTCVCRVTEHGGCANGVFRPCAGRCVARAYQRFL